MRRWLELISTAWVGVATHKLRSFLTILGVVIGVGAVITLMSIGKGAEAEVLSRIETLGADLIQIRPGWTREAGVRGAAGSATSLTLEDAQAIADRIENIKAMAPYSSTNLQLIYGGQNMRSQIIGVTPEYQYVYNWELSSGSFISEYDNQRGAKVAVIGSEVKDTLFGDTDPVGQPVRLENNIVRVVGVLQSKGDIMGSYDDAIMIPLTTLQQIAARSRTSSGEHVISGIALKITDQELSSKVVDDIRSLLRDRHQLSPTAEDDFRITSMDEIAETVSETMGTMTILLGSIAAISLLVGGIGVMNIMLVSVLERTREIGILKALGATEQDIWGQFLIEAVFLTFIGGIAGVILGWITSMIIGNMGVMETLVSADTVILAVSVSVCIGLFFGFYPAWRGSRLNPIEALRYE